VEESSSPAVGADVILTGIARSGTTLACTLLNQLPDTVALHEPMSPRMLVGLSVPEGVNDRVAAFFASQRRSLLERGEAISRGIDGKIPDNPYAATPGPNGLRASVVREGIVHFDKPLTPSFRLVVKHPSCFTALLGALTQRFACHAIIRNPLAVLLSWQTTEANWNHGRQPAAEVFDDDLRLRLDAEPDRLGRQLAMLSWSFGQYARHLRAEAVIRYEDLIATGGGALARVAPTAGTLAEPLRSRNANPIYGGLDIAAIARRLLATSGPQWDFYPRDAVREIVDQLASPGSAG
jgi:Sulfotransferase domain